MYTFDTMGHLGTAPAPASLEEAVASCFLMDEFDEDDEEAVEDDDEEEEDMEYIIVPKRTRLDPTAISNPNPFSKYNTEMSSEVNFRRLRMKFRVRAEESEV